MRSGGGFYRQRGRPVCPLRLKSLTVPCYRGGVLQMTVLFLAVISNRPKACHPDLAWVATHQTSFVNGFKPERIPTSHAGCCCRSRHVQIIPSIFLDDTHEIEQGFSQEIPLYALFGRSIQSDPEGFAIRLLPQWVHSLQQRLLHDGIPPDL